MTDNGVMMAPDSLPEGAEFEDLVRRYGPLVYRVCRDVLGDPDDAMDASQATFLVLVRRSGTIRDRASFGPWLYGVASRIARRERARLARRRTRERQVVAMDVATAPDAGEAGREARPILHEEIGRLPSKLREAVVLCYMEGLTVERAATQLACPVGTLKSRLGRGREVLRSRLGRRGLAVAIVSFLVGSLGDAASASSGYDVIVRNTSRCRSLETVSARVARMVREEESARRRALAALGLGTALLLLTLSPAGRAIAREIPAPAEAVLAWLRGPNPHCQATTP